MILAIVYGITSGTQLQSVVPPRLTFLSQRFNIVFRQHLLEHSDFCLPALADLHLRFFFIKLKKKMRIPNCESDAGTCFAIPPPPTSCHAARHLTVLLEIDNSLVGEGVAGGEFRKLT